jgi:hypothetical protein
MSLRFAVHNADGTFAHAGMTMSYNSFDPDPRITPEDERAAAEDQLRPLLNPGQRLTVGWDECEICGAPLTDSIEYLSHRPFCSPACTAA